LEYGHTLEKQGKNKGAFCPESPVVTGASAELFQEMVQLANDSQFADLFQWDQVPKL
jgi:hypothetical protein